MSLRTPLARVRGLGSSGNGTGHFLHQRLTALALVPLTIWFVASLVGLAGADHGAVNAWLASPLAATCMILLLTTGLYHFKLGADVVIEDYVHTEWLKITLLIVTTFASAMVALAAILAVLKIFLAGP